MPIRNPSDDLQNEELFLFISGMSCSNCSRIIENSLSSIAGIISARVYLAEESAEILYDKRLLSKDVILEKISALGYEGRTIRSSHDDEIPWQAVVFTAFLTIPTAYLAMFGTNCWANRFSQMVLSGLILMTTGRRFFSGAVRSLKSKNTNMDVLVALGVGVSWSYSAATMVIPSLANAGMAHFETASVLVLFILFGKMLESTARKKAAQSLRALTDMQQKDVRLIRGGRDVVVNLETVKPGDLLKVLPGERFPTDGTVVSGSSLADESLLTGEPMPVSKEADSAVSSGTLNVNGELIVRSTKNGASSTLQTLIRVMRRAQADKPQIQRFADKASEIFVPVVIVLSLITFFGWIFLGSNVSFALMHAVAVLVVACPCALGLATPTAIIISTGIALRRGILVKKPSALEALADVKYLLFDKTGTLTEGKPKVHHWEPYPGLSREDIAGKVVALAAKSTHPLAGGIHDFLQQFKHENVPLNHFEEKKGFGITAETVLGEKIFLGSLAFMESEGIKPSELSEIFEREALTPVYLAIGNNTAAVFGLWDPIKDDAESAINSLKARGIEPVMVSGDRRIPVNAVAKRLGIGIVRSQMLPAGKLEVVKEFLAQGATGFVGDGINDAAALSGATVGIAMASGADIAQEATDLVLMDRNMLLVPFAVDLAKATLAKIRQNLIWAIIYNIIALPLAAGFLIPFFGPAFSLTPEIAGLTMALSSVSVVCNSLLLLYRF